MTTDDNRPERPNPPGEGPDSQSTAGGPPSGPYPPPPGPYQGPPGPYQGPPGWNAPPPKKRRAPRLLIGIVAIVALCCLAGVIAVAVSVGKGSKNPPSGSGGGLNQPVRDGKFEFTVHSVQCGQASVGAAPVTQTANGQFCLVSMTVKNIGNQSQGFSDQEQKALSPQGSEYTDNLAAGVVENGNPVNQSINPGNQVNTVLVYDIPKSAQINRLQLHDSAFSGGVQVTVA